MTKKSLRSSQEKNAVTILVIGPHPDDIEFGCGGTLLRYGSAGNELYQLILTDGCFDGNREDLCYVLRGSGTVRHAEGFRGLRVLRSINDQMCL